MTLGEELIERLGAGERGAALGEVAVLEGLRLPLKLAHVHARCLLHLLHHAVPESERLRKLIVDLMAELNNWGLTGAAWSRRPPRVCKIWSLVVSQSSQNLVGGG